jgi:hypothetical protein
MIWFRKEGQVLRWGINITILNRERYVVINNIKLGRGKSRGFVFHLIIPLPLFKSTGVWGVVDEYYYTSAYYVIGFRARYQVAPYSGKDKGVFHLSLKRWWSPVKETKFVSREEIEDNIWNLSATPFRAVKN